MRIGVNARLLIEGKMDGIGWFACQTLRHMVADHPDDTFVLFFDRQPASAFRFGPNVETVVLYPPARHPVLWLLFFEWSLRRALHRYHCDVLLSPDGYLPLQHRIPSLVVIHDLNFEHARGNLKWYNQLYLHHFFPRFARCATRIATVSEYSRDDIAATYHVDKDKIDVVYDGAHDDYRPHSDDEKADTRALFTGGKPYLIFVSTILPRKNLTALFKAFDALRERKDLKLVVVGSRVWWRDELKQTYQSMRHRDDVLLLGHCDTPTLARLLSAAEALVYPSFFEGFGIPILEAFHAETAVVTSNVTSMPEVAGDAALLIDPYDWHSIVDAVDQLLTQPQLRQQLIERGRRQRERFSWKQTADKLWQSLMRCMMES